MAATGSRPGSDAEPRRSRPGAIRAGSLGPAASGLGPVASGPEPVASGPESAAGALAAERCAFEGPVRITSLTASRVTDGLAAVARSLAAIRPDGYRPQGYRPQGYRPDGYRPDGYRPQGYRAASTGAVSGPGGLAEGGRSGSGSAAPPRGAGATVTGWAGAEVSRLLIETFVRDGGTLVIGREAALDAAALLLDVADALFGAGHALEALALEGIEAHVLEALVTPGHA